MNSYVVIVTGPARLPGRADIFGPYSFIDAQAFMETRRERASSPRHAGEEVRVQGLVESPSFLIGSSAAELWRAGEDWTEHTVASELRAGELRQARIEAQR